MYKTACFVGLFRVPFFFFNGRRCKWLSFILWDVYSNFLVWNAESELERYQGLHPLFLIYSWAASFYLYFVLKFTFQLHYMFPLLTNVIIRMCYKKMYVHVKYIPCATIKIYILIFNLNPFYFEFVRHDHAESFEFKLHAIITDFKYFSLKHACVFWYKKNQQTCILFFNIVKKKNLRYYSFISSKLNIT